MPKTLLAAAALFAFAFTVTSTNATAQSIHFVGGGLHIDVGNPHGTGHFDHDHDHFDHVASTFPVRRSTRTIYTTRTVSTGPVVYPRVRRTTYYPVQPATTVVPSHTWHDTSHWDTTPTQYTWHGNHWDVTPGRTVWHQDGHWDHNHP